MGLANRLVEPGRALDEALALARQIAAWPQGAVRSDRRSSYEQWSMDVPDALLREYEHGMGALGTGELRGGLDRYASGRWRDGDLS